MTQQQDIAGKHILRVFPRRTKATPDDNMAVVGNPDLLAPECDEIHVSCAFTWDVSEAHRLAEAWEPYGRVLLGGPALGARGDEFAPGRYLKTGYVITSRGCPNKCWFCSVPKREGALRELPITEGWNVLDDNLLACSESHVRAVFAMLHRQPERAQFTGGLEAARLQDWHVDLLVALKPKQVFFAYDTSDDLDPLVSAGRKLLASGFTRASHTLRCYVLCGWPRDTFAAAESRLRQAWQAGFVPMAMVWRGQDGIAPVEWRRFQREWARPAIMVAKLRMAA